MLTVTKEAGAHLVELLDCADAPLDVAVRMLRDGKNVALQLDREREGDATIAHEGRIVLLFDADVAEMLDSRTLDVHETDDGPALAFS